MDLPLATAAIELPLPRWDYLGVVEGKAGEFGAFRRHVPVARTVESVSADLVFFIIFVRNRIHRCVCRHRLVECGIENSHLRHSWQCFRHGLDTEKVGRIVQRSYIRTFFDLLHDLVVYQLAAEEFFPSVHYTVSYRLYVFQSGQNAVLLVKKGFEHHLDCNRMVRNRHFPDILVLACRLMLDAAGIHSYPFHKALGHQIVNFVALHVKQLILER